MDIGAQIKRLRMQNNLTQKELADRAELSKGFISQVERNLTSPSIATLIDILECLGTDLKNFFDDTFEEKIVFGKEDVFEKDNSRLKHHITWLIPNAQKNSMEPIILSLQEGGKSEIDSPHDGEEFGYVLVGRIDIHIGPRKFRVKKGESFYFKPTMTHFIENAGKTRAEVLWIAAPPTF